VGVGPRDPRLKRGYLKIHNQDKYSERKVDEDLGHRKRHQSHVATDVNAGTRRREHRHDGPTLFQECVNSQR
jgi:hypothetical protein